MIVVTATVPTGTVVPTFPGAAVEHSGQEYRWTVAENDDGALEMLTWWLSTDAGDLPYSVD